MDTRQFHSLARGVLGFVTIIISIEALRSAWLLTVVCPEMEKVFADMLGPGAQLPGATKVVIEYGFQIGMGLFFLTFCAIFWMWKNLQRRVGGVLWVAAAIYLVLFSVKSAASAGIYIPLFEIFKNLSNG